ncbi:metallophosphoesterase [Sinorhizobium medicae]|uniref:metallophosphoesterase n=2 Tax=Sinorhizobium medicae TaxID=110321 RepID=UPI0009DB596E|nr:metallophosphoesterase [Sinorhizobium medicae]MDX0528874.1 metallophosphoesterase [Sinorhizobium medicae]MDX0624480.1 metallophosphoesterase [Sinorhizobium medicae]MDX0790117.1 metallophosphoesterase [Sinorhizobium medicae]WQO88635.1 metallophosphoesterase [Sinorhizobium medicae]
MTTDTEVAPNSEPRMSKRGQLSRRAILAAAIGASASRFVPSHSFAQEARPLPPVDVTFLFAADIHACRMATGLSPNCQEEGKTDENLLRHIAALNGITRYKWPTEIAGRATELAGAGMPIATPAGLVIGGDMTDDGGGQVTMPSEGTQLLQFSHRYQQGVGEDRVHFPVYVGLGNHDLDQDGPAPHSDWYRRELRDYVEINHRPGLFFKPPVPADNYDPESDCFSWDWGGLHLVQLHRFGGDKSKGAVDSLTWLKQDLATSAGDGRPIVLFQHYGWDPFSTEDWDPERSTFDEEGSGPPHWWSEADRRALLAAIDGYNVIGVFHGHQHETPMIYRGDGLDLLKPKAAFMGGFAVARITADFFDVVLAEASDEMGLVFTHAFSKVVRAGGR